MSVVERETTLEEFKRKLQILLGLFEKETGEEIADETDRLEIHSIYDLLESIGVFTPYYLQMKFLVRMDFPEGSYTMSESQAAFNPIGQIILNQVQKTNQLLTTLAQNQREGDANYLTTRKQHLEWLSYLMEHAKYKIIVKDTVTLFIELLVLETPMSEDIGNEEPLDPEDNRMVFNLTGDIHTDDLKNKMTDMPRDEYIALVKSEAKKFEPQIKGAKSIEVEDFFVIDEHFQQFISFLRKIELKNDHEVIKYILDLRRTLYTKVDLL